LARQLKPIRLGTRHACVTKNARTLQRPYAEVRGQIGNADVLLFRGGGIIPAAGRGVHRHAAMAAWWGSDLFCLETRSFRHARAVLLSHLVRRWPARIDVFRANAGDRWRFDRCGAVAYMRRLTGLPYGWWNLLLVGLVHAPLLRWCVRPDLRDAHVARRPPFCSQAVATACRLGGGVDPVPQLADRVTEPADLARSAFFSYQFTLV